MMAAPIWHGTDVEASELLRALAQNCECTFDDSSGARTSTCPAHALFASSQEWLDRLLFLRRLRDKLNREEGSE